jgi:4-amino-4-deoxy-L-arabinose transferase-like glycosyltransferase
MTDFSRRALLAGILLIYLALAVLFAVYTPAWQAPDEPAHYNYVRHLAEHGRFPVLQAGDYPHDYLERIKSQKFPPELSIDPIRYEFHQPPLYYLLATPVYWLAGGRLMGVRLFSALLGGGIVLLAYAIGRRVFGARSALALGQSPGLALGAAAFVALLPQHLATVAQVGNDVLAELLYAALLYLLATWVMAPQAGHGKGQASLHTAARPARGLVALGVLLGLILIAKTTAYIALPLAGGALLWLWRRERASARRILAEIALIAAPAAVIALPWYIRNTAVYGWPDFLGLIRHDQIVIGQMRLADFIAQYGWVAYWRRGVEWTFKSFWGIFGWMGAWMDSRAYFVLALTSSVVAAGLALRGAWPLQPDRGARPTPHTLRTTHYALRTTHYAIRLLVISAGLTLLTYAWYNAQFVQHQGRYLFTALIQIGLAFAAGWERALIPRNSRILAAGLVIFAIVLAGWGVLAQAGLPKWPLALTAAIAAGLAVRPWLPRRLDPLLFGLPFAGLPLLALYALFGVIVPQLAR